MQAAIAIQDVAPAAIGEDDHLARDVPAPIRVTLSLERGRVSVDPERMQAAIAVEHEAAGAVGQECEVASDIPAPVVAAAPRSLADGRRAIGVQAAIAVQDKSRLRR